MELTPTVGGRDPRQSCRRDGRPTGASKLARMVRGTPSHREPPRAYQLDGQRQQLRWPDRIPQRQPIALQYETRWPESLPQQGNCGHLPNAEPIDQPTVRSKCQGSFGWCELCRRTASGFSQTRKLSAGGGTRTHTLFRARAPKARTAASYVTPAMGPNIQLRQ